MRAEAVKTKGRPRVGATQYILNADVGAEAATIQVEEWPGTW